jgi:hypothetical protein
MNLPGTSQQKPNHLTLAPGSHSLLFSSCIEGTDNILCGNNRCLSSYLDIIAHLFTCVSSLTSSKSDSTCTVAVFDTALPSLKLPLLGNVLPASPTSRRLRRDSLQSHYNSRLEDEENNSASEDEAEELPSTHGSKLLPILPLAEKYFELSIEFTAGAQFIPCSQFF